MSKRLRTICCSIDFGSALTRLLSELDTIRPDYPFVDVATLLCPSNGLYQPRPVSAAADQTAGPVSAVGCIRRLDGLTILEVLWTKTRPLGDACQHARSDLFIIVEGKDEVRPSFAGQASV